MFFDILASSSQIRYSITITVQYCHILNQSFAVSLSHTHTHTHTGLGGVLGWPKGGAEALAKHYFVHWSFITWSQKWPCPPINKYILFLFLTILHQPAGMVLVYFYTRLLCYDHNTPAWCIMIIIQQPDVKIHQADVFFCGVLF